LRGGLGIARGTQLADQPSNVEPALGVATSVTTEPRGKLPTHPVPEPQLITTVDGVAVPVPVTRPVPFPTL
jgi:hypothetical protein